jgi:hypothetical protein
VNKKVRISYRGESIEATITGCSAVKEFSTLYFNTYTTFQIFDEDCHQVCIEEYKTLRLDLDEITLEFLSGTVAKVSIRLMEVYA